MTSMMRTLRQFGRRLGSSRAAWLLMLGLAGTTLSCRQDMHDMPRYEPLEYSDFFRDEQSSRLPIEGTVARGQLREDELLFTGKINGEVADIFPFPITRDVLNRGRERYDIYCSPCHGQTGEGNGMIVQRGFKQPPSLHLERLRQAPAGYYFDVITNGFGSMYSYAARLAPRDRWAVAAYVRALQLSQNATIADVPESERRQLEGAIQ